MVIHVTLVAHKKASIVPLVSLIAGLGLAGLPPHMATIHANQPAVLLSHINEPATIRSSQPNRLSVLGDVHAVPITAHLFIRGEDST